MRHVFQQFFDHAHVGHAHSDHGGEGRRRGHHAHPGHGGPGEFFGRGNRFGGGFFGGGGGGGGGMRAAKMLASGDLQLVTLALLQDKPRYGYEIIKALEEHSSGVYTPSPGMVYPALTYLEEVGHADCAAEGKKKLYSITEAGSAHLAENRATADETLAALARFGEKLSSFQRQMNDEEQTAEGFGRGRHGHKHEWRELKSEFRDLKEQLRAAIFEKIDAPMEEKRRILNVLREAIANIRGK